MESMGFAFESEHSSCCMNKEVEVDMTFTHIKKNTMIGAGCPTTGTGKVCAVEPLDIQRCGTGSDHTHKMLT